MSVYARRRHSFPRLDQEACIFTSFTKVDVAQGVVAIDELRTATGDHHFRRAAGLASVYAALTSKHLYNTVSLSAPGDAVRAALLEGVEALRHFASEVPSATIRKALRSLQMEAQTLPSQQKIALELAGLMIESKDIEQAHVVLDTNARSAKALNKFLLESSAGKLRYQQWLEAWKADGNHSDSPDWERHTDHWSRETQELWAEAEKQLRTSIKEHPGAEVAYLIAHLDLCVGHINQAVDVALQLCVDGNLDADCHALLVLLLEMIKQSPERLSLAYMTLLECDPRSQEALWGFVSLAERHPVPLAEIVRAYCLHLDTCSQSNDAGTAAVWTSLAELLLEKATMALEAGQDWFIQARRAEQLEPTEVVEWRAACEVLRSRADWWPEIHFTREALQCDRSELLEEGCKAMCAAFMPGMQRGFCEAMAHRLEAHPESQDASARLWHVIELQQSLRDLDVEARQDERVQADTSMLDFGDIRQLPRSWWHCIPQARRQARNRDSGPPP